MSKIAFVSKKNGAFHLVADAAKAPELFAAHLIRTQTDVGDYELFASCSGRDICLRAATVLKEYRNGNLLDRRSVLEGNLSPEQIEVLKLIGMGLVNKEIADKVNLSVHCVKYHIHEIRRKLGMHSRLQLFVFMGGGKHEVG